MAISSQSLVQITLFHPYETVTATGIIQKIDPYTKQLKFFTSKGKVKWYPLDEIISLDHL
ncbi:YolD-like family protein [Piscibacillus salipiscarius]|nr:YolD-like family protein [Piscibacillus salipiscarius]